MIKKKNLVCGVALAFFFGCIGLHYSAPKGAIFMGLPSAIALGLTFVSFWVGLLTILLCNVISSIWAHEACITHNQYIDSQRLLVRS